MRGQFFTEFFAGCGIVSKQVRAMGFATREWELLKGGDGDLTSPAVRRSIRQMAMIGQILSAFLAPPCGAFSLINRSVRRTETDPLGLSLQESDKSRASATLGRQMYEISNSNHWLVREVSHSLDS